MKKLIVGVLGLVLSMSTMVFAQTSPSPLQLNPCSVAQQNVQRLLEGSVFGNLRCTRDGSVIELLWLQSLALEGRVFTATFGANTTVITGKAAFTSGSPEINLDVPVGITIIPVYLSADIVAATSTGNHLWLQVNGNLTGNGTSTVGSTPVNMRVTDQPFASRVTTRQQYTVAGTAPTTSFELSHIFSGFAVSATSATPWEWTYNFAANAVVAPIVGPASVSVYSVCAVACTFQARIMWIELPSSAIQ